MCSVSNWWWVEYPIGGGEVKYPFGGVVFEYPIGSYRASAQRSRLIPLCFYAMMNVDYTSLYYVIADACASKISISFSHLT